MIPPIPTDKIPMLTFLEASGHIEAARTYQDLFPLLTEEDVRARAHAFTRLVHPDRHTGAEAALAQDAQIKLARLKEAAERALRGEPDRPASVTAPAAITKIKLVKDTFLLLSQRYVGDIADVTLAIAG